jgi:protein-tyrosine phosphatase
VNEDNVIAVHCNHGKGRTGTAIINILLYLGIFKTASEALTFYNDRRFSSETYGVDQPCQTRYLNFVQNILSKNKINPKLAAFNLNKVSITGLH